MKENFFEKQSGFYAKTGSTRQLTILIALIFAFIVSLSVITTAGSTSPPRPKGQMVLQPFDYRPVTLDGGCHRAR